MISSLRRIASITTAVVMLVLAGAAPASAHVKLVSSTPADQATLSVVPSTLELTYSTDMAPAGTGIVLTDKSGATKAVKVTQPGKQRLIVQPDQPLGDGGYLLSWTVRSGDSHPLSGAVGFAVAQATGSSGVPAPQPAAGKAAAPAAMAGHVMPGAAPPHGGAVEDLKSAVWLGRLARWLSLLGALLGIGVLAFAASSLTGSIPEVRAAAYWVRRAGLAVVIGTLVEVPTVAAQLHGGWGMGLAPGGILSALEGQFIFSVLLRIGGGVALLFGAQLAVMPLLAGPDTDFPAERLPERGGSVAVLTKPADVATHRLNIGQSRIALAGAAVVAFSYLFDGHTVMAEPAWLVRIADVAHVFGAGVWVGGVAMMAWVLKRRSRRNTALRAGELAIRFSTVAACALVVVATAGVALSFSILDSPKELINTAFGRLLLIKMLAVGAAATIGGYNHHYVIPNLVASPTDVFASEQLRTTVRIEAWILVGVVGITAALVAAAT